MQDYCRVKNETSVEAALVKNVQKEQDAEEPYFTEKKSEIALEPAKPGVYTSHDLTGSGGTS